MGMDLYVYEIVTPTDKNNYYDIGRKPIQIEGITCECIEIPDHNYIDSCIKEALTKHGIEYIDAHERFCYDFSNGKAQVNIYTDETVTKFKTLSKIIDDLYDGNDNDYEREEAHNNYNAFGEEVASNPIYWKDTLYFSRIPLVNTYRLLCDHNEVNYARKPFREIKDKDYEIYRMLISGAKGDSESAFVIFDKATEMDFKQLIRLVNDKDMKDHLNSMLPLKENQIISIDW
jgi:hypothetical protein